MTVYFIQCGEDGPIKIGYTKGLASQRLDIIQTTCPFKLRLIASVQGDISLESKIHQDLEKLRMHGEWFRPSAEVFDAIKKYTDEKNISEYYEGIYLSNGAYDKLKSRMNIDKFISSELGIDYKLFVKIKGRKKPIPEELYTKLEKLIGKKKLRSNRYGHNY